MPRTAGTRSASVRLNEIIENTCEAAWGSKGLIANITTTEDATIRKVGTKSAKHVVATAFTTGVFAWTTASAAAWNMNTANDDGTYVPTYTHAKMWVYASAAIAAGALTYGLDDAVGFDTAVGIHHFDWSLPAIPAAGWYRIIVPIPLTLGDGTELASVDSFGFKIVTDLSTTGNVTVYFDDIRLCNYVFSGDADITLPSVTAYDGEILQMPFRCENITVHELPIDLDVQYRLGANNDTHSTSDVICGYDYLQAGQTAADLQRNFNNLRLVLGADLGAAHEISLLVQE